MSDSERAVIDVELTYRRAAERESADEQGAEPAAEYRALSRRELRAMLLRDRQISTEKESN
jgi:hypothetical protein